MAKAAQVVLLENEYYLIKAPGTERCWKSKTSIRKTALRSVFGIMQATPGSSGSSWTPGTDAGGSKTALPQDDRSWPWAAW